MRLFLISISVCGVFHIGSALPRPNFVAGFRRVLSSALASSTSSSGSSSSSGDAQQQGQHLRQQPASSSSTSGSPSNDATCTELDNRETFYTVSVQVGTPPRKLSLVADTGSGAILIPSCSSPHFNAVPNKCYEGAGRSSTFRPPKMGKDGIAEHIMTFGSGKIVAHAATDVVRVGKEDAMMQDSLMLMVEADLDDNGSFEGILGLGQPMQTTEPNRSAGDNWRFLSQPQHHEDHHADEPQREEVPVPGFLEQAGIGRFSICFNDGDQPGLLRFNVQEQPGALASIAKEHWALGLQSISVGDHVESSQAVFCGEDSTHSEDAGCAMIPDTGTTVMMGPKAHIMKLFSSMCDAWPRCRAAYEDAKPEKLPKHEVFQKQLHSCTEWISMGDGLKELPSIHFHLQDQLGIKKTATLSPWAYVVETDASEIGKSAVLLGDLATNASAVHPTVCMPAFGVAEISSSSSGQVWLFGTPFFYDYVVTYDWTSQAPSVTFSQGPCGRCHTADASFVIGEGHVQVDRRKQLRRLSGTPRTRNNRKVAQFPFHF